MTKQNKNRKGQATLEEMVQSGSQLSGNSISPSSRSSMESGNDHEILRAAAAFKVADTVLREQDPLAAIPRPLIPC
ncbi:MAG: hypothetical protein M0Q99_05925 [Candidatus Cloacimonetes bacterium]|nr:hypothetical protein [Candidatus Cloacimonadota bacterium]